VSFPAAGSMFPHSERPISDVLVTRDSNERCTAVYNPPGAGLKDFRSPPIQWYSDQNGLRLPGTSLRWMSLFLDYPATTWQGVIRYSLSKIVLLPELHFASDSRVGGDRNPGKRFVCLLEFPHYPFFSSFNLTPNLIQEECFILRFISLAFICLPLVRWNPIRT